MSLVYSPILLSLQNTSGARNARTVWSVSHFRERDSQPNKGRSGFPRLASRRGRSYSLSQPESSALDSPFTEVSEPLVYPGAEAAASAAPVYVHVGP